MSSFNKRYRYFLISVSFAVLLLSCNQWNIWHTLLMDSSTTSVAPFETYSPHSPWPFRNDTSNWCYPEHHRMWKKNKKQPGLLFIKVPKTGSSTLSGLNIRIARQVGSKMKRRAICSHSFQHGREYLLKQSKQKQLRWSFVREPSSRALSAFFHFQVSRKKVWPTMGHLITYLQGESVTNFQFVYLAAHPEPKYLLVDESSVDQRLVIQRYVSQQYDFIGVVERWTQSLAVMALLWNLSPKDFIVLSSKMAGAYDDGRYQTSGNCVNIQSPSISLPQDKEYLQTFINSTFKSDNSYDYKLYAMVEQRLDATIEMLGKERVESVQKQIETLQSLVESKCLSSAVFPCSSNGTWQFELSRNDCYWYDSGCGYPCVDRTIMDLQL